MILLDTNALYYLGTGHRRARPLERHAGRLRVSPVSLLELQLVAEVGRIRWAATDAAARFRDDPRWKVDDPTVHALVESALAITWTREPFDRLLVAHASLRRWKLATSDGWILEHLPAAAVLEL